MVRVLMAVGREHELFFPDNLVDELKRLVNLTERNGRKYDEATYARTIGEHKAEIVITGWASPRVTTFVQKANPQLTYLCNITGGIRHAVTREVIEAGLRVSNWGALIGKPVAEATLLSMLTCLRKTVRVSTLMHVEKGWRRDRSYAVESLYRQTIGLHGFGNIARCLVGLLSPFACTISAFDPYVSDDVFREYGVKRVENLVSLYAHNRIVSIHAPKIDETYHIVDAALLAAMPDGAILVNTARGNIVDTDALVAELETGRISASIDVYEEEPLPGDSPLRGLQNCHLTPHTAGPTRDRYADFGELVVENIRRYVRGEPLKYTIDIDTYDRMT